MDKDPETDSYYYIEIIMEALAVLGDIPSALEVLLYTNEQTKKKEVAMLIETLIDHV